MIVKKVLLPALLTSLLLSLPYLFEELFFLIFIAFACLLFFYDNLEKKPYKKLYPVISIALWHYMVLFWLNNEISTSTWDTVLIITFSIIVLLTFLFIYTLLYKKFPQWRFFKFLTIWIAYEILLVEWDIPFQMLSLGNVLGSIPKFIQWYSFTGILGGTFWILAINFAFLAVLKNYTKTNLWHLLFVLVIPTGISLSMFYTNTTSGKNKANIVTVNLQLENRKHFNNTVKLLKEESDTTIELIVCPEGIVDLHTSSFPVNMYFSIFKKLIIQLSQVI